MSIIFSRSCSNSTTEWFCNKVQVAIPLAIVTSQLRATMAATTNGGANIPPIGKPTLKSPLILIPFHPVADIPLPAQPGHWDSELPKALGRMVSQ
ncbi:hypothetical protein [Serratia sp. DD3]|uniref:hypothetical protein n=1 Tax=Serratia sp. DD3 TaxID=1410619 RepID=UPI001267DB6D|nr:hypothetical protein [Serratia sp. DD3]